MSFTQLSSEKRLVFIREAIQAVQSDPVLSEAMAAKGYSAEQLAVGLALQQTVDQLTQTRNVHYGSGIASTGVVHDLEKQVRGFYAGHRKLARLAFKGQAGLLNKLNMPRRFPRNRENLVQKARHFYTQVLEQADLRDSLVPYGLTDTVAGERLMEIANLEAAMLEQQQKRAEAEVMTLKRTEAVEELEAWSLEFLGVARLVFKGERAQLKKLGLPIVIPRRAAAEEKKEGEQGAGEAAGEGTASADKSGEGAASGDGAGEGAASGGGTGESQASGDGAGESQASGDGGGGSEATGDGQAAAGAGESQSTEKVTG